MADTLTHQLRAGLIYQDGTDVDDIDALMHTAADQIDALTGGLELLIEAFGITGATNRALYYTDHNGDLELLQTDGLPTEAIADVIAAMRTVEQS